MTPRFRVGLLATHPIQYYVPWYRELAKHVDLEVFFSHRQTAEGQADAGFDVPFAWDVPLLDGYRHVFLENVAPHPDVNTFFGCDTPEIKDTIKTGRFDAFIVHGWSTRSYWQAIQTCWQTRTPILVRGDSTLDTPRSLTRRAAKYPLHRWFVPRFDAYLTVGSRAKAYLIRYGASPDSCFDAPHAVDNDRFQTEAERWRRDRSALRRSFAVRDDATVFLFVGKFIELKRPELFIAAIAEASRQDPGVVGLMVGDGPLRGACETLAETSNAPVKFAGFMNQMEIPRAYAASDVLVVPSAHETWGLAVNEAMACGLPAIVTTGVGCSDDLVLPGQTGERFAVDDRESLVSFLLKLSADRRYLDALSRESLQHIQRFSVTAAAAGTVCAVEHVRRRHMSQRREPASSTAGATQ